MSIEKYYTAQNGIDSYILLTNTSNVHIICTLLYAKISFAYVCKHEDKYL